MSDLASTYATWKQDNPKARIRDAATALGVSELELLLAREDLPTKRLDSRFQELYQSLTGVGRVMVLTRNEVSVHERSGNVEKVQFHGTLGGVYGPDIDLRLMTKHWAAAVACEVPSRNGVLPSIQFFNAQGRALHKVYLKTNDRIAWDALIAEHLDADASAFVPVAAEPPKTAIPADPAPFQAGWEALQDTHGFFILLHKHGIARRQAMDLAPAHRTERLDVGVLNVVFERAAASGQPIMVFVSSGGVVQIHSGSIKKVAVLGDWLNILDPDFNLHVNTPKIESVWWVSKPTKLGGVHALEAYDADGNLVLQLFGERNDDDGEREDWRGLLTELKAAHSLES